MITKGIKFDNEKLDYSLLPIEALEEEIKVLMIGAEKYESGNWRKVPNGIVRYINAAYRHLGEIVKLLNEDRSLEEIAKLKDADDNLHPLAHASCDIHFALWLLGKISKFDNETWKTRIQTIKENYSKERENVIK
jgi:hypothetical protein